ncbi:MAG TPA: hypothetical protein PKO06_09085, partial [Candidatus Ozemobacteraceae bacterium]|nr:hypothetical protein [Candidatus Ozemobacteraceae bacterium]
LLGVIDSARNRSFVFSQTGQLLSELSGPTEACFYQNELVQLQISGNRVHARVIKRGGSTDSLFTAETTPGNVWLDAQAIGAIGSTLVVIGRQGQGDEDHPVWSRVLVYRQGTVRSCSVIPHLGLHAGSPKSYTLLTVDGAQSLIDLDQHPEGIAVRAFRLP